MNISMTNHDGSLHIIAACYAVNRGAIHRIDATKNPRSHSSLLTQNYTHTQYVCWIHQVNQ